MSTRPVRSILCVAALALATAACGSSTAGSGGSTSAGASSGSSLRVLAASSLKEAFPKIAAAFATQNGGAKVTFEFLGSDELATQIDEGAAADVFAAASPKYPDKLHAESKLDAPVPFATNTLVLAVPAGSTRVADLAAVAGPGVRLVIGAAAVPVGAYTRTVLAALDATEGAGWSATVLKNVVSEEPSVKSIVAKLDTGDADAGFVYATDVRADAAHLTAIAIPAAAKPTATYPIAVVSASKQRDLARRFCDFVLSAAGQQILVAAGFGAKPAS